MSAYMPFISFLISFLGLILILISIFNIVAIKREFSMYFDKRDEVIEDSLETKKKKLIISSIMGLLGIILVILSYII